MPTILMFLEFYNIAMISFLHTTKKCYIDTPYI